MGSLRGLVLGVSQLDPHHRGRGPSAPKFGGFPSTYAYTICHRTTKFDVVTHRPMGLVLGVSQLDPHHMGSGPSAPKFGGFPSTYAYSICCRTTKFDVTHAGRDMCLEVSALPIRREQSSSDFCSPVCPHPLTQNDQIRHGNTYGEGVFFRVQPRHCICTNVSRGLSATAEFLVIARQ